MTSADVVGEAVAELYAADPDAFTERRGDLVAQARAAGDAAAAKAIAGLRKPTRAAWMVNQLIRSDPGVPVRLAELGDELRAAEGVMDGAKIRELSLARRRLIDALLGQALALVGLRSPPAGLREEVTTTFAAALADPRFAEQLAAGVLLRAERRPGFGSGAVPALMLVPGSGRSRPAQDAAPDGQAAAATSAPAAATATAVAAAAGRADAGRVAALEAARAERERSAGVTETKAAEARAAAEADRAERERERREAIAEAEQALSEAEQAADAAAAAEREQENAVRMIAEQLVESRQRLIELRLETRRAKSTQRRARDALGRVRPQP